MKLFTLFWRDRLNPQERELKAISIVYIPRHRTSTITTMRDYFIVEAIISERNVPLVSLQQPQEIA